MVPSADERLVATSLPPTLLVVEDEPLIRMDLADVLRHEGFTVIEAAGPAEARDVISSGVQIACVLSDLHMPTREAGLALLQWLGRERPSLPVFVASGVPDSVTHANKQGANVIASFEKPYRPSAIVIAVRALLARGETQS